MNKKAATLNERLVNAAYAYFILIGVLWIFFSFYIGGMVSWAGMVVVAAFGVQARIRHRLANLILGLLTLAASLFMTLEFLFRGLGKGFNSFLGSMTVAGFLGIILSGALIFNYTHAAFRDR